MSERGNQKPRVWRALGVVLIALLGVELFLQIWIGGRYTTIYRIDERYLLSLIPNSSKIYEHRAVNGGGRVRVSVNSQGFRGEEFLSSGAATRVLVYGDSFIEGEYSELEATFVEQLESRLAEELSRPVEAINAGVVAFGPDQVLLRMEDELQALAPDLVVVSIFCGNDFGDLIRNRLFRLDQNGDLQAGDFELDFSLRLRFATARYLPMTYKVLHKAYRRRERERFLASLADDPTAQKRLLEEWHRARRREYRAYIEEGDNVVSNLLDDSHDVDVDFATASDSARYKLALMEQVLVRIQQVADAHGVPLLLVIVPSPIDVIDDYDVGRVDPATFPAARRAHLTNLVSAMAHRHSIPNLDLFPAFRQSDPASLYFRGGNNHWNERGQALAARRTTEAIVQSGLISPLSLPEGPPQRESE